MLVRRIRKGNVITVVVEITYRWLDALDREQLVRLRVADDEPETPVA